MSQYDRILLGSLAKLDSQMSGVSNHSNQPGTCFADAIRSLADDCDNEYYMSAMGSPSGSLERARRGRLRILEWITEFENLNEKASCLACHQEITRHMERQRDGVLEIERVWKLSV